MCLFRFVSVFEVEEKTQLRENWGCCKVKKIPNIQKNWKWVGGSRAILDRKKMENQEKKKFFDVYWFPKKNWIGVWVSV